MRYRDQLALLQNRHVIGDNHEELKKLPADFFHCAVTSPPYFGLRDYGTRRWFGGDPKDEPCPHLFTKEHGPHHPGQVEQTKWKTAQAAGKGQTATTLSCVQCGAWYGQLGLEPTPDLYVEHLVEVFRGVKRVLRPDGVFWLNVGDSYDKEKSLIGIPWLVALALRKDGWLIRQEIVWEKPNVMPESVRDRPTRAHEQVFLLTKNRDYFYDQEAEREPYLMVPQSRPNGHKRRRPGIELYEHVWEGTIRDTPGYDGGSSGRNLRTVWKINPQPYHGAHFAVFPMKLPERCIKLGTSEHGACAACGAPFERIVERVVPEAPRFEENVVPNNTPHQRFSWEQQRVRDENPPVTIGWEPTCKCKASIAPCVVLDPFLGSGTTVAAAIGLLRTGFGIEINPAYEELIVERKQEPLDFSGDRSAYEAAMAMGES